MRFMMLMHPNISEQDWTPDPEAFAAMGRYNDELSKAGVLLALDGLHPASEGARVRFAADGGAPSVTDGPFAEAKEVIGGYWVIQASSREEAVEWATRCPAGPGNMIEVRRIFELSEFPEDIQAVIAEIDLDRPEQSPAR